jgi:hypothetical protein
MLVELSVIDERYQRPTHPMSVSSRPDPINVTLFQGRHSTRGRCRFVTDVRYRVSGRS